MQKLLFGGEENVIDSERKKSPLLRDRIKKKRRKINDLEESAALSTGNGKRAEGRGRKKKAKVVEIVGDFCPDNSIVSSRFNGCRVI